MKAEIIAIGDEVLLGHIVDTNSPFIARELSALGFTIQGKSAVGDNVEAMEEAFRLALKRSQVVIVTGGLGPTDDDLTKRAIVKVFKRNLILNDEVMETIQQRFAARGMNMPALSQNQALLPQGATLFPNRIGSAVGICMAEQGRVFIALPGVPVEMRQIMTDEVVPYLAKLNIGQAVSAITMRTTGTGESHLSELIAPDLRVENGVKLAYLPHFGSVDLRVVATAPKKAEADEKAARLARHVEKAVGSYLFGHGDETLAGVVGQLLKDNDKSLAVAESCTAGQLGMTITDVPGASAYFRGGLVAYDNDIKIAQLGVPEDVLAQQGAVSEECAAAMAFGCRKLFRSDYALSVTGIAGPDGGTADKPVGTTWIGFASAHAAYAKHFRFGTERLINRTRAVNSALELLRREILDLK
jgi:nicotinamide-nucleotide amidase